MQLSVLLKPDYPMLAWFAGLLGLGMFGLSLPGVLYPERLQGLWKRFPRDRATGVVLTTIAMFWASLWVPALLMEFIPAFALGNPWIAMVFFPVSTIAVCSVLRDLLACRSAGLLFVLIPTPLLASARWHPSPARYLAIACAYGLVVAGMFSIAKPWLMRDWILACNATTKRTRIVSAVFLALSLLILFCAVFAYPATPDMKPLGQ